MIQRLTEDRWETFDVREDVGRARSQLMEEHLRFLADVRKRIFTTTLTKKMNGLLLSFQVPHLAGQQRDEEVLAGYIK